MRVCSILIRHSIIFGHHHHRYPVSVPAQNPPPSTSPRLVHPYTQNYLLCCVYVVFLYILQLHACLEKLNTHRFLPIRRCVCVYFGKETLGAKFVSSMIARCAATILISTRQGSSLSLFILCTPPPPPRANLD